MMKRCALIAICFLTFTTCKKVDSAKVLNEDKGCIEEFIFPVTQHTIDSSELTIVNNLFLANNIDNNTFRYFKYIHDTLQTLSPPYTTYDQKTIRLDQYTNGLRIFERDLVYNFLDNNFHFKGGELTHGTSLNIVHQLTLGQVRKLFVDDIDMFDPDNAYLKDSCLKAEFGYYDLNAGTGNTVEALVKAWRVIVKGTLFPSEYPQAYYQDNGNRIYYDNGIRTFR